MIFCSFLDNVEIIVTKICFWKENLGSPNAQDHFNNGHLPYHWARALDEWHGMWICVRSRDAQKQLARTSLRRLESVKWLCCLKLMQSRGRGTYVKEVGLFSVVSFGIINCDFLQQLGQLSLPLLNVFRGCNNFISLFFNTRR